MATLALTLGCRSRRPSRIDKDAKDAKNKRIFDLWLACHTQQEIAESEGCTRDDVRGVKQVEFGETGKLSEFPKTAQAAADHATDFEPPIYNIWKRCSEAVKQ